jgi:hypothetical protein
VTTHVLDFEFKLMLAAAVCALFPCYWSVYSFWYCLANLESKMFKKMGGSIGRIGFCSTSGVDPDTNGRGLSPWRVLCCNLPDVSDRGRVGCFSGPNTVKPFERVVLSVLDGVTGLA